MPRWALEGRSCYRGKWDGGIEGISVTCEEKRGKPTALASRWVGCRNNVWRKDGTLSSLFQVSYYLHSVIPLGS